MSLEAPPPGSDSVAKGPADPSRSGPGRPPPHASLGQIALTYGGITLGTLAIEHLGQAVGLAAYTHVALAGLFLTTAIQGAQRAPGGLRRHGLWLGGLLEPPAEPSSGPLGGLADLLATLRDSAPSALREVAFALVVAAITFPPFAIAFYLFHQPQQPFAFRMMPAPVDFVLSQLLVVALPEEALFRGYLQTRLVDRFPAHRRWLRAQVSPAALGLQAVLFALLHVVVDLNPARLAVFFPALLFGWMREARGGIGASLVYHALCNLLSELLIRGFF